MKKRFTILALAVLAVVLGAQAADSTAVSLWWGNYSDQSQTITGNSQLGTYEAAMFVSGSGDLKGVSINAVRFRSRLYSNAKDVKVWVRSSLDSANLAEATVATPASSGTAWSEAQFATPVALPETGAYVGYSFTLSNWYSDYDYTPVVYVKKVVDGGFYLKQPGETKFTDKSATGSVAMQINISGNDLTKNAASILDNMDDVLTVVGDSITLTPTLRNLGAEGVNSIDYTYTLDGSTHDGHAELATPIANIYQAEGTATLKLAPSTQAGTQEVTIRLTKVNGETNGAKTRLRATVNVNVLSESAPRKSLVEVYVDKSKYNSGRGYVGVKHLVDSLSANVIPLTIHMSDSHAVPTYKTRASDNKYYNAPLAEVNRSFITDPYYGANNKSPYHYNADLIKASTKTLSEASVAISKAEWTSEKKDSVKFTAKTTFKLSSDEAYYRLAYAVIEDSIKTAQDNMLTYYKSSYPDDDMEYFRNMKYQGDSVVNLNLVVAASDADGVERSIPRKLVADSAYTYEGGIAVPAVEGQTPVNQRIVVFLVNTTTKDVVNAEVAEIKDATVDAITNVRTAVPVVNDGNIYNIAGQKVTESYKGIVIKNGHKYIQK